MNNTVLRKEQRAPLRALTTFVGSFLCVLLAFIAARLFPSRIAVAPLIFIGIVFATAWLFGSGAGILGAIGCALVFAYFVSPSGSFRMVNGPARNNLAWLLMIAIPACYLFIPHKDGLIISRKR
ncbi:MAG: hypothetical protein JWO13_559 [Acidobacteriales bacterium]|nr:hypothetical protein [Terriglobales bacterium]